MSRVSASVTRARALNALRIGLLVVIVAACVDRAVGELAGGVRAAAQAQRAGGAGRLRAGHARADPHPDGLAGAARGPRHPPGPAAGVERVPRRAARQVPARLGVDRRRPGRDGGQARGAATADGGRRHPLDRARRAHRLPARHPRGAAARRLARRRVLVVVGGARRGAGLRAALAAAAQRDHRPRAAAAAPRAARARPVRAGRRADLGVVRRRVGLDRDGHLRAGPQRGTGGARSGRCS